nr:hypothetical protein BaRGS_004466 [Batillaria attramentaria]
MKWTWCFHLFQIQVWQYNNKASTVREWNISAEEALETRVGNTFTGRVEGLLPVTDMQASVAIMNNFYISQPTDAVNFTTTAGERDSYTMRCLLEDILVKMGVDCC